MKKMISVLFLMAGLLVKGQPVCSSSGNLMLFTNYDGGTLTINVDQNIPNLKIGVCSYESCVITLTGAFVNNVTGVHYAGFNGANSTCGSPAIPTTTIIGAPGTAATSTVFAPASPVSNPNGNNSIICGYSCNNTSNQGGCNTVDQVEGYFLSYFAGSSLYAHKVQYGCWSGTHALSSGGTCCPAVSVQTVSPGSVSGSQTICIGTYSSFVSNTPASGGTGPVTYTWQWSTTSPTSGFSDIPGANGLTYFPVNWLGISYYRRAASTSTNPASYSNVLTVMTHPVPNLSAFSVDPSTCAGTAATLLAVSGGGSVSCTWEPGSLTGNPAIVTPTSTLVYTLTATDQNNCSAEAYAPVIIYPLPTLAVTASYDPVCSGSVTEMAVIGALSYTWLPGPVYSSTLAVTPTASVIYTVTGFSAPCANTATLDLTVLPLPTASISTDRSTICIKEALVLTASGGTAYTWLNPGITAITPTVIVTPTVPTSYSVVVTGTNGCTGSFVKAISVSNCTGIDAYSEGTDAFHVTIFPNPNSGEFYIAGEHPAALDIINTSGQLVKHLELTEKNDLKVSVAHLAPGIYFVMSPGYRFKQKIVVVQ